MKPEELILLVVDADRQKICAALSGLNEAARAKLAPLASRLYKQIDVGYSSKVFAETERLENFTDNDPEIEAMLDAREYPDWRVPRMAAGLAILGLCGPKEIEQPYGTYASWICGDLHDMPQRCLQVLADRKPPWLKKWIDKDARQENPTTTWFVERGLIRCGALPTNTSDGYVLRMAMEDAIFQHGVEVETDNLEVTYSNWYEVLCSDPELVQQDIWRLFEVEHQGFAYRLDDWVDALSRLVDEGQIDRIRLLRSSAEASSLPIRPTFATAFGKFHEQLQPTVDERVMLVDAYLTLLRCPTPTVVGFALKALEIVAKAKRLDANVFLESCRDVFFLDKKTYPIKTIKLIKLLVKQSGDATPLAVDAYASALKSPLADVQETAVSELENLRVHLTEQATAAIHDAMSDVVSSLQPRVNALLETETAASPADGARSAERRVVETKSQTKLPSSDEQGPVDTSFPDVQIFLYQSPRIVCHGESFNRQLSRSRVLRN